MKQHGTKTFAATIPTKVWDRETRAYYTQLHHVEVDIDVDAVLRFVGGRAAGNRSGKTRQLGGMIVGRVKFITPQEATS